MSSRHPMAMEMRQQTKSALSLPGVARQAGDQILSGTVVMLILCKGAGA